jgi:MFS family permease
VTQRVTAAFFAMIAVSIVGNYFAGWLAQRLGNRRAIVLLFLGLAGGMAGAFGVERGFGELAWFWCQLVGFFSGAFGLFTMYLPPLFPTLLRTTGAGFCYNIGRAAAAVAQVVFGVFAPVNHLRGALLASSTLALAAAAWSCWLPQSKRPMPTDFDFTQLGRGQFQSESLLRKYHRTGRRRSIFG